MKKETYIVKFREQGFLCYNNNQIVCTNVPVKFHEFTVKASSIEEAYLQAVQLVRQKTSNLVQLEYCYLLEFYEQIKD